MSAALQNDTSRLAHGNQFASRTVVKGPNPATAVRFYVGLISTEIQFIKFANTPNTNKEIKELPGRQAVLGDLDKQPFQDLKRST